jgi:cell division protein FtsB
MAYNRNRISHKKELYYIVCIVTVAVILLFSLFGPLGYGELRKARLELQERRKRVETLTRLNEERKKNIEGLRSDREAVERYAREKGYAREGDIIYQLPSQPEKKTP